MDLKKTMGLACMLGVSIVGFTGCSKHDEHTASTASAAVVATPADAQTQGPVTVSNVWVRPALAEQDATGGYLTIQSTEKLALVGVSTPLAEVAEVHEMRMDGDVMRMRMLERLNIEPGKPLELKPGGNHLMLMALKGAVEAGQQVDLNLLFEKPDGTKIDMPVKATVRGPAGAASGAHQH
ncbi:MAG TPA: copper chaperone PCu(A)C [Limnobacter sp.]|uniref:copper chaperone PCu(A)C n=1 Tax=Limnobacter sp. TaxID=2003368 RepID=UPI002ED9AC24